MDPLLKEKAQYQLSLIEEFYLTDYKDKLKPDEMGLLTGLSGVILLQALFLKATKNKLYKEEIDRNLERLIETIEGDDFSINTFCDGLAGIGWLFIYLHENKVIDIEIDDFLTEMDEVLESALDEMLARKNFDVLHGSTGLGLYFLKRSKYKVIEKIIKGLDENREVFQNEFTWRRFDFSLHKGYVYDFGLAHGNVSILYFLTRCYQENILPAISLKLIEGGINFYRANIQNFEKWGSYFPNELVVENYKVTDKGDKSRLAWCYGDLGILHSLILISRWIDNPGYVTDFTNLLVKSLNREVPEETMDTGFCHGSAGIGYMCLNLYKTTKAAAFSPIADYWIEKTILSGGETAGKAEYSFYNGLTGWDKNLPNLLTGLGGAGLILLSVLNEETDESWNEIFCLS